MTQATQPQAHHQNHRQLQGAGQVGTVDAFRQRRPKTAHSFHQQYFSLCSQTLLCSHDHPQIDGPPFIPRSDVGRYRSAVQKRIDIASGNAAIAGGHKRFHIVVATVGIHASSHGFHAQRAVAA